MIRERLRDDARFPRFAYLPEAMDLLRVAFAGVAAQTTTGGAVQVKIVEDQKRDSMADTTGPSRLRELAESNPGVLAVYLKARIEALASEWEADIQERDVLYESQVKLEAAHRRIKVLEQMRDVAQRKGWLKAWYDQVTELEAKLEAIERGDEKERLRLDALWGRAGDAAEEVSEAKGEEQEKS